MEQIYEKKITRKRAVFVPIFCQCTNRKNGYWRGLFIFGRLTNVLLPLATYKTIFKRFTIVTLLFIGGLTVFFLWSQIARIIENKGWFNDDTEYTFSSYPGFGIWIPDQFEVHGIDVSRYQKRINWKLVKGMKDKNLGLHFAFIKATEGASFTDAQFKRNWRKAREAGLVRGAYHFFRESSSGHEQAMHYLDRVELQPGDLPPVLDVELYTGADVNAFIKEIEDWLKVVEHHTGVRPLLYTNASFYNKYLSGRFDEYPLWVAHYKNQVSPKVNRNWLFWQHSETGRVNGINAFVDFNVFNGTRAEFDSLLVPGPRP